MNIYTIVEGKSEKTVYPIWIPLANPALKLAETLDDVTENNFYIVSAGGYPQILDVIDNAIEDVNAIHVFNRLVISVDSDEAAFEERLKEIGEYVSKRSCRTEIRIIIQHFCFETWALGNRQIIRKSPQDLRIRSYINMFDVRVKDPELLPANQQESLTRVRFAEKYLRAALNDRYSNLTYSKGNPSVLLNEGYFTQVKNRLDQTGHVASFSTFLDAFT
jgi:hypothetical protein